MSIAYYNLLCCAGSHETLEKFMLANFKIRYDLKGLREPDIPLFCLSALLPEPKGASADQEKETWGCFETSDAVTYPDVQWNNTCETLSFSFKTRGGMPHIWFNALAKTFPDLELELASCCPSSFHAVIFNAKGGQVTYDQWTGNDYVEKFMADSSEMEEDDLPPRHPSPVNPDFLPSPTAMEMDGFPKTSASPLLSLPQCSLEELSDFFNTEFGDGVEFKPFDAVTGEEKCPPAADPTGGFGDLGGFGGFDLLDFLQGSAPRPSFNWRGFLGLPPGMVQDTSNTLHVILPLCDRYHTPIPGPMDFGFLRVSPKPFHVNSDWDRYSLEKSN